MSNEIELYTAADLAPYSPSHPLAPAPSPDFGNNELDLLRDSSGSYTGGGRLVFGQPLPPNVTLDQLMAAYQQLGDVFSADFMRLRHNVSHTQKCVSWFLASITNPPAKQKPRHNFNLYEHVNDPLFQAFANYAYDQGFSQKLISDACWWVSQAGRKLSQQYGGNTPTPRTTSHSTEAMLAQLSDTDYNKVIKINEQALANTMQVLQRKWGEFTYLQNIQIAQKYLDSLPAHEQRHFDQFTSVNGVDWVHMRNTVEFITAMFDAATGAHNLPTSGGAVQAEINQIESLMRTPATRRAYLNDPQLQGRLRTLYDIRDKGK